MKIMFNPVQLHNFGNNRQIASNPIRIKVEFTFYSSAASSFYDNFYDIEQSKSIIFVSCLASL